MVKINGFKVIGPTEVVVGKVVELFTNETDLKSKEESTTKFKLVEYYVNEYNTYLHRTITTFEIKCNTDPKQFLKEFKKALGENVRINEVFIEKKVMELLTK